MIRPATSGEDRRRDFLVPKVPKDCGFSWQELSSNSIPFGPMRASYMKVQFDQISDWKVSLGWTKVSLGDRLMAQELCEYPRRSKL